MLIQVQKDAAAELLCNRPAVFPGTRVIVDDVERKAWYGQVRAAMQAHSVHPRDTDEFCDLAGVPD
jgi:hypothetical protein